MDRVAPVKGMARDFIEAASPVREREPELWWQASMAAMVGLLRQWPTAAVLRVFTAAAQVLTERGEWAAALEQACVRVPDPPAARGDLDREERRHLREFDAVEPPGGCRFWTAALALGCLALPAGCVGALLWWLMRAGAL